MSSNAKLREEWERNTLEILTQERVLLRNSHFIYKSKRHGTEFVAKDLMLIRPRATTQIARLMVSLIRDEFGDKAVDVIAGAATAGAVFSHQVAREMYAMLEHQVHSVFADKEGEDFVLRRGYEAYVRSKRVVFIEDVTTTGLTTKGAVQAIKDAGGIILGAVAMWNRGNVTPEMADVPTLLSLVNYELGSMSVEECREHGPCSQGVPVRQDFGHGTEYLKSLAPS